MSNNAPYHFRRDFMNRFNHLINGERTGKTNAQLARETGISEGIICNYKFGKCLPRADYVYCICKAFGVSADWLLGLSDKGGPEE